MFSKLTGIFKKKNTPQKHVIEELKKNMNISVLNSCDTSALNPFRFDFLRFIDLYLLHEDYEFYLNNHYVYYDDIKDITFLYSRLKNGIQSVELNFNNKNKIFFFSDNLKKSNSIFVVLFLENKKEFFYEINIIDENKIDISSFSKDEQIELSNKLFSSWCYVKDLESDNDDY